jgi:acyl-CoA synthetase (AMP-forming)/AMP-acid ligase II
MGNGMRGDIMVPLKQRFGVKRIVEVYGATEGVGSFINFEEIPGVCGNLSLGPMRQGEIAKYDLEEDELVRDENGYAVKVEVGETGLLLCEINQLNKFAGYVNNPAATEEKLLHDVFGPVDTYFDSGDLVQLHDKDYFSFVDRLGDTFRWKSENVSTNQVADVLMDFGGFEDANVFGVKVPGTEGRCGMVAFKLLDGAVFDPKGLAAFVMEHLPSYARPYFVRLRQELDVTNSFKRVKKHLQADGFDPAVITDALFFLHPQENEYVPLTPELYRAIAEQSMKF